MNKLILATIFTLASQGVFAQKTESVHGTYSYTVGDNENITLAEVKQRCIVGAQSEAIKEKFKENISSKTNMVDANINGEAISQFIEEIETNSVAEWIGDKQAPVVTATYADDKLTFTAEVWGEAREITQSKIDLDWKILCNGTADSYQSTKFNNKDRLFIKFKSPVSGYLAIYALDSPTKTASCLLPYRRNTSGRFEVKSGQEYVLFDKATDANATIYNEVTSQPIELDNIVLIFSPNPFTKCNDVTGDYKHPNSLSTADFEKWLRKIRKQDKDMVVDRSQWITIVNDKAK